MPQGIQVWDENFNLILDTNHWVLKSVPVAVTNRDSGGGSFGVAAARPEGSTFIRAFSDMDSSLSNTGMAPAVLYDNNSQTVSYQYNTTGSYLNLVRMLYY